MEIESFGVVLQDVARFFRADFIAQASVLRMTPTQLRTLAYLKTMEGCSQRALAERLEVQPMTLARQIDQLEKSGLVARRADDSDRRAFRLYLTARAAPRIEQMFVLGRALQTRALRKLSGAQRQQLLQLLLQVRATQLADREAGRES